MHPNICQVFFSTSLTPAVSCSKDDHLIGKSEKHQLSSYTTPFPYYSLDECKLQSYLTRASAPAKARREYLLIHPHALFVSTTFLFADFVQSFVEKQIPLLFFLALCPLSASTALCPISGGNKVNLFVSLHLFVHKGEYIHF
jgi:hypothetical protein